MVVGFDVFAVEILDERGRDGSEEGKEKEKEMEKEKEKEKKKKKKKKKRYDECYLRRVVFPKSFVESFNTVGKAAALVIHVLCFVCKTQKSVRGR